MIALLMTLAGAVLGSKLGRALDRYLTEEAKR